MIIYKEAIEKIQLSSHTNNNYSELSSYELYFKIFQALFLLTVAYVIFSWFFGKIKEFRQLKNERTEAELAMLKSKVDPHFFFNTLNNLYALAIKKSDETPKMIHKLSEIMRYTIYEGENEWVKLEREITYLEQYIEIHKIRYKKNVDVSFNKKIEVPNLNVAPLLFVMLLENAFKHGVESLTNNAFVKINLIATSNSITFNIENNFDPKRNVKKGIGLKNLKRRLSLIYPKKHELVFSSKDDVYSVKLTLIIK
jgi:LytS/YehU family sensor histidine kinase